VIIEGRVKRMKVLKSVALMEPRGKRPGGWCGERNGERDEEKNKK
jgi:hypothetical protein